MANFSQLRRRQSSREILYRRQFSQEFDDIHMAHLAQVAKEEGEEGGERSRHHSAHAAKQDGGDQKHHHELERQSSQAVEHADPDELGTLMWEVRPRCATSAGELKRKYKKERRMTMEKEKQEVRTLLRSLGLDV